ncbi:MAG: PDZ domain-containing protein [Clostridia bacterium]|nr:PDZ domain-containing protein [Clostridia bacterium]
MKKFFKKTLTLLLTLLCVISIATNSLAYASDDAIDGETAGKYFDAAVRLIMSRYKFDTSREGIYKDTLKTLLKEKPELLEEILAAMFDSLDDYSVYYTQEELDSFIENVNGEFCGIGVVITTVDEGLLITTVYDNTPAKEAGLMVGDVITKVGDISIAGMDISLAQSKVMGEENTPVNLTILRNGISFEVNPIRRKVVIESGFYQTVEDDTIGYITISDFNDHSTELTKKALKSFDEKGITKVILDLRNNPGGALNSLVDMCSLFIPTGPAITLEYKNPFNNITLYAENPQVKYNLAVLVNSNSASASEAFAAAVKDTKVGVVIGTTTFGKGTMQNITRFNIGGGVKLTEAEFLSPLGNKINGIGVKPHIEAEDKMVPYNRANLEKFTYDRVLKLGDEGNDVLAVEERLYLLGYSIGLPDKIFDERTYNAIYSLQKKTQLYPYGVADITTQLKLDEILRAANVMQNNSYKKAIEIFKDNSWSKYVSVSENQ